MVAVDEMILGPIPFFVHNNSMVLSNKPVTEPKGPFKRCNSSCIIKSGGSPSSVFALKKLCAFSCQANIANLSTVPNNSVGGF